MVKIHTTSKKGYFWSIFLDKKNVKNYPVDQAGHLLQNLEGFLLKNLTQFFTQK